MIDQVEKLESKFRFVHAAARRARQLQSGAQPQISVPSRKPTRVAMEELLGGAVTYEIIPESNQPAPTE